MKYTLISLTVLACLLTTFPVQAKAKVVVKKTLHHRSNYYYNPAFTRPSSLSPAPAHPNGGNVPTYNKTPGLTKKTSAQNRGSKVPGLSTPVGERTPGGL